MRRDRIRAAFVGGVPDRLEEGVLYVSLEHDAMLHLCACGCGHEVSTPLGPTDWRLTWDGASISLSPSVGSGALACRSHYLIERNAVRWLMPMTDWSIADEQDRTRAAKDRYWGPTTSGNDTPDATQPATPVPTNPSWWGRMWNRVFG
ncbi:hypothetical protein GGQ87_001287 [Brevundimonas alba]|uniref:Uncharacterized protein n=1 Tax=Brevundimonas alba TaxID=74314 RepID=A0A7X6BNK0_9CAUL|nr:DUF6527 family protein [Brevundimonas alba]NJC41029.1 hypothetical protein [Brevundimonas alba]